MTSQWILTSKNVCVDGSLKPAWILIDGEKIAAVLAALPQGFTGTLVDCGQLAILPGIVDSHVHINEPGRTEWEGFTTATHAASAGGITTLVDMPLNCIPVTTTAEAFAVKQQAIQGKICVDIGFWGGATKDNAKDLPALLESGVLGVKTFMIDSGIPEFSPLNSQEIAATMPHLAARNMAYLFHAEIDQGNGGVQGPSYKQFLDSRPKSWEDNAIKQIIDLTRVSRCRSHIVHLSSADSISQIRAAKAEGIPITAETCPHYLVLNAGEVDSFVPSNEKTLFKCCPPIREESNRQKLWHALMDGTIDMVVSDHSPCTPGLKSFGDSDFGKAWGGISSLQFVLPLLYTAGQEFSVGLAQISHWLSRGPAKLAGIDKRKGQIKAGMDADFLVFDPKAEWEIKRQNTLHRHSGSPYLGRRVKGKVLKTYLRGKLIFDQDKFINENSGSFILRGES